MTNVDFFLLPDADRAAADHYACVLSEQSYKQGKRVLLRGVDEDHCLRLDQLLWTFRDSSFLPHGILGKTTAPVLITCGEQVGSEHQVLINLSSDIPQAFSRFERICEMVIEEESSKLVGREHYRFYRDRGYPLKHHPLRQRILSHSVTQ